MTPKCLTHEHNTSPCGGAAESESERYSRDTQHVCHVQVDGTVGPPAELCPGAFSVGQGILINGVSRVRLLQEPPAGKDLIDNSETKLCCFCFLNS